MTAVAVSISPIWNGQQFLDNDGLPLNGGLVFQYEGGSFSVQQTTYTTSAGTTANANPITLDSSGRIPTELWLQNGLTYNLVLTMPDGTTILTHVDGVIGVQPSTTSGGSTALIWNPSTLAPTYVNGTTFVLADNEAANFAVGNRVKFDQPGGSGYGTVTTVSFSSPNTTVTLELDSISISAGITAAYWSSLIVAGRTVDAGAVSYSPSTQTYPTAGTVGNKLRSIDATGTALNAAIAGLEVVLTTTGTSSAFVLTPTPAATSYAANQIFNVLFHTAGGASCTLNVSSLGAKSIKQYDSGGALTTPVIQTGMISQVMYDGTEMILLDQLPPVTSTIPHGSQVFTANGTFTPAAGVTSVKVLCVAGGGGGGSGNNSGAPDFTPYTGGTGGFGGASIATVAVTPATGYGVSIGSGGAHSSGTGAGSAGGNSTFGSSLVTASAGAGGGYASTTANGTNGANGVSTVGDYGTSGVSYAVGASLKGTGGIGGIDTYSTGNAGSPGLVVVSW